MFTTMSPDYGSLILSLSKYLQQQIDFKITFLEEEKRRWYICTRSIPPSKMGGGGGCIPTPTPDLRPWYFGINISRLLSTPLKVMLLSSPLSSIIYYSFSLDLIAMKGPMYQNLSWIKRNHYVLKGDIMKLLKKSFIFYKLSIYNSSIKSSW